MPVSRRLIDSAGFGMACRRAAADPAGLLEAAGLRVTPPRIIPSQPLGPAHPSLEGAEPMGVAVAAETIAAGFFPRRLWRLLAAASL